MAKAAGETYRATDIEGVFMNAKGVMVDSRGVAVGFKTLKKKDEEQRREVLGHDVREPHELLKALSMDPRYPLSVRVDCAKAAAPYFAAKKEGGGLNPMDPESAASLIAQAVRAMKTSVGTGKAK